VTLRALPAVDSAIFAGPDGHREMVAEVKRRMAENIREMGAK